MISCIRIYNPTRYNATATDFRSYGAISRFDHHRSQDKPTLDKISKILYFGKTLSCCLVEYFGDGEKIDVTNMQVTRIYLSSSVTLLDLKGSSAMLAGTVSAISATSQRNISQAWGRYFYENPQLYGRIDGLIFSGAHNGEDAIALYERAESIINSSKVKVMNLNHPTLRTSIFKIAKNHSLLVEPY